MNEDQYAKPVKDVTRGRVAEFTFGLDLFEAYQWDLPSDAPLFFLSQEDGAEFGEPGFVATIATANLPDADAMNEAERGLLTRRGWYQNGTWRYLLTLGPSV